MRPVAALVCALVLQWPVHAVGQADEERAVRLPTRLTAGGDNRLMGALSPDEKALYFISDENGTFELFVQDPVASGPRLVFDAFGDIAWPALSPNGRQIAYISYARDAKGDVCVRELAKANANASERCLSDDATSELQAAWHRGSDELAVLSRTGLHADFRLVRYEATGEPRPRPLSDRNMTGLALSPDGRWLAYNPVERRRENVGVTFSNRTSRGVRLQRLGSSGEPIAFEPNLPGVTGAMAFSRQGDYFYFAQYLNDTNRDRVINGNDNSVIFRVPFASRSKQPLSAGRPEQLTSSQWNCHYPAPAKTRLVMTCSHHGSLDIYSLPLDGAIPATWSDARVKGEIGVARDLWTQLLLYARLLATARTAAARRPFLRAMATLHLRLREYESAVFYADVVAREAGKDEQTRRWAVIIGELAKHRRADVGLARGQLSRRYVGEETVRARQIAEVGGKGDTSVVALARIARSELFDDLGDKRAAFAEFENVRLDQIDDPSVLLLYAHRAQVLYGSLADRAALVDAMRRLSEHEHLDVNERLRYAREAVSELTRGRDKAERKQAFAAARQGLDGQSEFALMIDVEAALNQLNDDNQEEVRKTVFELFKHNEDPARRRAISLATVQAAAKLGNEYLQYQFATSWASGVRKADPERKYAEELYRTVVLERAYGEIREGEIAEARAHFFGASRNTLTLEAHIGFIEARIREGKTDTASFYDKRFQRTPKDPAYLFVKAYLLARELPQQSDATHEQAVDKIVDLLADVDEEWPRRVEVHHLWAYALHHRAMRTKSRQAAIDANQHYLLALDLAQEQPRARATTLLALALLTSELGNHRKALEFLSEREALPFPRPEGELAAHMAKARSLYFTRRDAEARGEVERALALVDQHRQLNKYRLFITDRLAFYHLSAGEMKAALERYRQLVGLLKKKNGKNDPVSRLNQVKANVGLASAQVGSGRYQQALATLKTVDQVLAKGPVHSERDNQNTPRTLLEDYSYSRDQYRILVAGLRAQCYRGREEWGKAQDSLLARRKLLTDRYDEGEADEDLLELARAAYHLAEIAYRQGNALDSRTWFERGLAESARYNDNTGSTVTDVHLALLRGYAELHLYGGVPRRDLQRNLEVDLRTAYNFITEFPDPNWTRERFLFALYLTMLSLPGGDA